MSFFLYCSFRIIQAIYALLDILTALTCRIHFSPAALCSPCSSLILHRVGKKPSTKNHYLLTTFLISHTRVVTIIIHPPTSYNFVISHFIYTFRRATSHYIDHMKHKHKAAPLSSLDVTSCTITDNFNHSTINGPLYHSHTHNPKTSFSLSIVT